jgi:hypothetical protein
VDKEAVLPPSGIYHSQQCYHSHLLWFKIITPTLQTGVGEGPNTRGRKGVLNTDHKARKTSPVHLPTKQA